MGGSEREFALTKNVLRQPAIDFLPGQNRTNFFHPRAAWRDGFAVPLPRRLKNEGSRRNLNFFLVFIQPVIILKP
jgi:hypothetical protein